LDFFESRLAHISNPHIHIRSRDMTGITFTLTTNHFGPVVCRTITSLAGFLNRFNYRCNLLIIDKSPGSKVLGWLDGEKGLNDTFVKVLKLDYKDILGIEQGNLDYITNAEVDLERDSIQRSRVQMILAVMHYRKEIEGSILWQLDDDMVFEYQESECPFPDVVEKVLAFHKQHPEVDAATGTGFHTPPLPVLLYMEKNLKDLVTGRPLPLKGLSTSPSYYHDLYTDSEFPESLQVVERSHIEVDFLFRQILSGDPVFRPIPEAFFEPEKPWHRGGNFILFNLEAVLAMPHLAVHHRGLTSRRSDMIHARLLHEAGFKISGIPLGLFHFREQQQAPNFTKLKLEYLRDTLGAVAVRFLDKEETAFERLLQHREHIDRLSTLVTILKQIYRSALADELLITLEEIRHELSEWQEEELSISLVALKNKYYGFLKKFKDEKNSCSYRTQ
jgi:hypothetical protein